MDLPNHPANPQQVVLPERQLIQRERAVYEFDYVAAAFIPAQGLPRWAERNATPDDRSMPPSLSRKEIS